MFPYYTERSMCKKTYVFALNPSATMSDQDRISPHNINTISVR